MNTSLHIARELASIAQAGLAYSKDHFDIARFARVRQLASQILQDGPQTQEFAWPAETGYLTPKVDVRAAVFRDGTVLLVREAASGLWTLPGGWADVNLSASENAERECLEESGFVVRAVRLAAVIDKERAGYPPHPESIYKILFLCEIAGGSPALSSESTAVEFFPVDHLPPLDPDRFREEDILRAWALQRGAATDAAFN